MNMLLLQINLLAPSTRHYMTLIFINIIVIFLQSDSVSYFLDELDRISRLDYVPSQKDILHCRKATKGVFEFTIRIQVSCLF